MLRPADRSPVVALHRQEPDLAHALEMGPHGVDVQPEAVGDVGCRQGLRRPGQFEVDRVPGVVAQRLEQVEARRVERSQQKGYTPRLHGLRR